MWALLICHRAASVIGGRDSGGQLSVRFTAALQVTLYILPMNSVSLTVRSSRSQFPRFLSSMWCCAYFYLFLSFFMCPQLVKGVSLRYFTYDALIKLLIACLLSLLACLLACLINRRLVEPNDRSVVRLVG